MPNYEAKFQFNTIEEGFISDIPANNLTDAEFAVQEHIREIYPDAEDVVIMEVKEMDL